MIKEMMTKEVLAKIILSDRREWFTVKDLENLYLLYADKYDTETKELTINKRMDEESIATSNDKRIPLRSFGIDFVYKKEPFTVPFSDDPYKNLKNA